MSKFVNKKNKEFINFTHQINFERGERVARKRYNSRQISAKLVYLTEYYKFHKDVPRIFIDYFQNQLNSTDNDRRVPWLAKTHKLLQDPAAAELQNRQENGPSHETLHCFQQNPQCLPSGGEGNQYEDHRLARRDIHLI